MSFSLRKLTVLISFTMLFAMFSTACQFQRVDDSKDPSHNAQQPSVIDLAEDVSIDAEFIQTYEKNGILRIECIRPGQDTFSLSVILYSLNDRKELGRAILGDGDWYTGWTDSGFYVASLSNRSVKLFDRFCQFVDTLTIPTEPKYLSFFAMNEAANSYFYGVGDVGKLYIYDLVTGTSKYVGEMLNGHQETLGYRDGCFYLAGNNGLLRFHENSDYADVVYRANNHLYKFVDMGISCLDDSFHIIPSGQTPAFTIPMQQTGEYPLAANASSFVTITDTENNDCIRLYNTIDNTIQSFVYPSVKYAALFNSKLLIHTYDNAEHHLYLIDPSSAHTTSSTFTTSTLFRGDNSQSTPTTSVNGTPPTSLLLDVPIIPQMPGFPTGCELVSAVMLLKYWGENVTVDDFIDNYLSMSNYFYSKDGVYYGPSPFECFVGDPRTTNSFGCMAPVILRTLNLYFGNSDRIQNIENHTLSDLCNRYVAKGLPVLVWVTINMTETFTRAQWRLEDGTLYEWPANEHCMVLVGYDERYYYFNDPYTGARVKYEHALCEDRYAALGRQALVIVN